MSLYDKSSNAPGPWLEKVVRKLVNRTGTTLTPGYLVAVNLDFSATSGQAMTGYNPSDSTDGAAGYVYGAAVAPTTANIRHLMAIVDPNRTSTVADNETFDAVFQAHIVNCYIEGSSGAGAGEWLVGTNGQYYATGQTDAELGGTAAANATDIVKVIGQILEAGPTGSAGTKKITFWGGHPVMGLICKGGAT